MSLVRWNPARELARMQEEMDRLFGRFMRGDALETSFARGDWEPAVDISETADNYIITAELPGLTKDDVRVSYEDGMLTIRGEKRQEKEEKGKNYHRMERSYGSFERSFRLPSRIVVDKIGAKFSDGLLTLTLPKTEEARPKEIPIKIG
ncbi:MAG: Hsp20/alpha crystallin family protein [candidate division KSB1 bacterium]|nr:Hsp20/alpha crystallin family protein [candidate division KSB1 bacterium]MDZ7304024.1 Hsp20/alpha crystallin family protein [candidate division KSB1 bacterium]MDZ7313266.1 Hsp20/alpha crystallin family protein [candidate division KSB1 bacterium]